MSWQQLDDDVEVAATPVATRRPQLVRPVDVLFSSPAARMDDARRRVVAMQCEALTRKYLDRARDALERRDIPAACAELRTAAVWVERAAAALEPTS